MLSDKTKADPRRANLQRILAGAFGGRDTVVPLTDEERDIVSLAPNAIEWCTSPRYLNSPSLFEYYRSYQTIRDYFELRCPECNEGGTEDGQPGDCWGKSRTYLESEVLLRWSVSAQEDVCPKCNTTRSEFIESGRFVGYNQMHLLVGMRAGKSMTAAMMGTYVEHVVYALGHTQPGGFHGFLGITPAETFEITFLASNQVQGDETIWAKYTGFRSNSPWFRRYVPWIHTVAADQPRFGMKRWKYKEGDTEIENGHPHVRTKIFTLNSNSSGQAGRTRLHGFLDELGRMQNTKSKFGAEEIYRTVEHGLRTIRSRVLLYGGFPWFGSMISVTSPMSRNDKAWELYVNAPETPGMYARHYPTWKFNPKEPREHFDPEYKKDPMGAERDFGANPPGAEHPLVHDETRFWPLAIDPKLKQRATFDPYFRRAPTGQRYAAIRLKTADRVISARQPRYIVFDAGQNFDAFSGACGHGELVTINGQERLLSVCDWVFRIVPDQGEEVWFDSAEDIVRDLKQYQSTAFVAFDRWNSVQIIQHIREMGIPAEAESLKDIDFLDWKGNAFDDLVRLIPPSPEDLLYDKNGNVVFPLQWKKKQRRMRTESVAVAELLELQCDPDTRKVYNPNKGKERGEHSDDTARVLVHLHRLIQRARFTDRYDDRSTRAARKRAEHDGHRWTGGSIVRSPTTARTRGGTQKRGW